MYPVCTRYVPGMYPACTRHVPASTNRIVQTGTLTMVCHSNFLKYRTGRASNLGLALGQLMQKSP